MLLAKQRLYQPASFCATRAACVSCSNIGNDSMVVTCLCCDDNLMQKSAQSGQYRCPDKKWLKIGEIGLFKDSLELEGNGDNGLDVN